MTRLRDLLPASFRSIPFFVRSEVMTEGGRRIVLHDYPNSSQRYVEDLGELPPKFSVTAFVSGPSFLNLADQLERALQEKGPGDLILPNLGKLSVYALPYRKDASHNDIGEIRFELSFVSGRSISGPVRAPVTVEKVYTSGDLLRQSVGDALSDKWIDPKSTSNVLTAIYDLEQCARSTEKVLKSLNNVGSVNSINKFIGFNAPSIVRSAVYIKRVFVDQLWQTVSVGLSGGAGLASLLGLTSFGNLLSLSLADIRSARTGPGTSVPTIIPTWPETTGERVIRNSNRLSLVNTHRICALACAYEQAADKTYQTDGELDAARLALETEHQRLMRVDTADRDLPQSQPEVRRAMEDMRLACLSVLDSKEQSAFTLTTLTLNVPSMAFVLAYDLYAESLTSSDDLINQAVILRGLNPDQPADKLHDSIMVLQR